MIKFGKKSWHRRIVTWGLGKRYFEYFDWDTNKWKERGGINLCPYMRHLLGVFLISPWIGLYKLLPKYCKEDHPDITKIFLGVGSICSVIHILATQGLGFEWWYVPVGTAIMAGIVTGVIGLIFGCMALKEWLDDRPVKEHKPSLLKEYMKAKHDKICPQVKFVG